MSSRMVFRLVLVLAGALFAFWSKRSAPSNGSVSSGSSYRPPVVQESAPRSTPSLPASERGGVAHPEIGFRSREKFEEHFAKHGREFGNISAEEYLHEAQQLRDAPVGGEVLEAKRSDGTVSRFDRRSGAFLAFDSDLVIRTFFHPNDGAAYFQRQLGRSH